MQFINLTYTHFDKRRERIIRFTRLHGDKRITRACIKWIRNATMEQFNQEGTLVTLAVKEKKTIGILIISQYGIDESFMAVHKQFRNKHVAQQMVTQAYEKLGKMYGRVALDNMPSLKVCLANGMVAFHLFNGPTGKPTLWLGGGNWKKEDVL